MNTCTVCCIEMTERDALTYGSRCEDCWVGGACLTQSGPKYLDTQIRETTAPFDELVKMGRGLARNGQVVRSGRSHGAGM